MDRAAIEVAARLGLRVYGWCPAGRRAEDGPIDDRYPLRETPSREAAQRTAWNVFDSDATLVLARGSLGEGASMAAALARRLDRPLLVVSGDVGQSAAAIRDWLRDFAYPPLLNVAGPRESADPGVERWASHVLERALLGSEEADDTAEPVVLVTGARGLLGRTLLSLLPPGWRGIGIARRGADGAVDLPAGSDELLVELSNPTDVSEAWSAVRPELVIHTAYGTADGRRDIVEATRNVVRATHESGAALIHVSTDMVFDGESAPYAEDARPAPVHEYGRLKAVAEDLVRDGSAEAAIVRMSLMMSFDPPDPLYLYGPRDVPARLS